MGGYGCLMLALRHPDLFSAVVSYGAALVISGNSKVYKGPEDFAQYDPRALVVKQQDAVCKGLRMRMVCGDSDSLYESDVQFKTLLESLKIPVDFVTVPGVAHCTQCLYEEVGVESLKFVEESFARAGKGIPANAPSGKPKTVAHKGAASTGEIAPFRAAFACQRQSTISRD